MGLKISKPRPPAAVAKAAAPIKKAVAKAAPAPKPPPAPKVSSAGKALKQAGKSAGKSVSKAAKSGKSAAKAFPKSLAAAKATLKKGGASAGKPAKKAGKAFKKAGKAAKKLGPNGKKAGKAAKKAAKKIQKSAPKKKLAVPKSAGKSFSKLSAGGKVKCPEAKATTSGLPSLKSIWKAIKDFFTPKPEKKDLRTKKNPRAGKKQPGDKKKRTEAAKKSYPGKQNHNNCGVQSSAGIIAQAKGKKPNETDLLAKAINNGWAEPDGTTKPVPSPVPAGHITTKAGGTGAPGRQNILADAGVKSKASDYSEEALAQAIWDKKGVIVSIHTDAASWWKKDDGTSRGSGKHALVVTDGEFDENGKLTHVYLNDTGVGMQGKKVPIADLNKASKAHGASKLNVTDDPIWP